LISRSSFVLAALLAAPASGVAATRDVVVSAAQPEYARFAHVNGTTLRYQLTGSGPQLIVLLHEMGMTLETWDSIVPELARTHRVLRYDLRGFGLSEKLRGAVTFDDEIEDLRTLLNEVGERGPVILVGGAVGGAIALRFAAAYPQRTRAVFAVSPAAGVASANRPASLANAAALERNGARAHVDASFEDIYPSSIQAGHPDRVARFKALQYANDPVSMAATLRMIAITDWDATWMQIQCPAWIVAAALYPARPIPALQAMAGGIANGHFEVLNTGHFMAVQSPELLQPLLQQFLLQVEGRTPAR
jgi:3-oxoadipate enol-lactonase